MRRKLFNSAGILVVLLALGLVLAGCKTEADEKGEYHLLWSASNSSYSTVSASLISQSWAGSPHSGTDWVLVTGSTVESMYTWGNSYTMYDSGDFDGSFERCVNFQRLGVAAPGGLKTELTGNKASVPLGAIFKSSNNNTVFFILTKN